MQEADVVAVAGIDFEAGEVPFLSSANNEGARKVSNPIVQCTVKRQHASAAARYLGATALDYIIGCANERKGYTSAYEYT
jgi:hypothetical protein